MKEYTLGLYEKSMPEELHWKEKLTAAKEAGYDFLEISIDQSEGKINRIYMPKEERLELLQYMYETGLPIRSMCVSALTKYSLGNEDPKICQRGMEIIKGAIKLADDLGVRIVMIPGYDVYYEQSTPETQQRFAKNLKKVAMLAAAYGVLVELETMENDFMNTVWKAMYYVKQINSLYLGVYPDSGNIKNAAVALGNDEAGDIISGQGHISSLHLKETIPDKFGGIPYGEGHVDFEKVINAAWNIGVRKYVTEFWYQGNREWQKDLHHARTMMGNLLEQKIELEKVKDG